MTEPSEEEEASLLAVQLRTPSPKRCSFCQLATTHPREFRLATLLRTQHEISSNAIVKWLRSRRVSPVGVKNHFDKGHHER